MGERVSSGVGLTPEAYQADEIIGVPVVGGELTVGVWGWGEPVTLAIHGITASHRSWTLVAEQMRPHPGTLLAPDLRGRGGSADLPGPYGMALHAEDCVAILDTVGAAQATVLGHSMGGFVAVVLAANFGDRVRRLVLVDGGVPLPKPPGDTVAEQLEALIGPAARRLETRFASVRAHHDFWHAHPAFAEWHPAIESYVDYDLTGEPPMLRSKVSLDAVHGDSADILSGGDLLAAWAQQRHATVFLRAERGLLNEETPLYPDPAPIAARMPVHTVAGSNHYTILLSPAGAAAVAAAVVEPQPTGG